MNGTLIVGRLRVIDRQSVLDAAELVVTRVGAAHLTLEAVALEAGISKASVIYDYKTKQGLIRAVIERSIARHMERLRVHIEQQGPIADRAMKGRLAAAASYSVSDAERTVALGLVAALAGDQNLRHLIEAAYREQMAEVASTSDNPRKAMLAFLALEGLSLMEVFGFFAWSPNDRSQLLADIGGVLAGIEPQTSNS